jgi:hypothetical protein
MLFVTKKIHKDKLSKNSILLVIILVLTFFFQRLERTKIFDIHGDY